MSAKNTHTFVVALKHVNSTISNVLKPLGLKIVPNQSDIYVGYFTVSGNSNSIVLLKQYLAGYPAI